MRDRGGEGESGLTGCGSAAHKLQDWEKMSTNGLTRNLHYFTDKTVEQHREFRHTCHTLRQVLCVDLGNHPYLAPVYLVIYLIGGSCTFSLEICSKSVPLKVTKISISMLYSALAFLLA